MCVCGVLRITLSPSPLFDRAIICAYADRSLLCHSKSVFVAGRNINLYRVAMFLGWSQDIIKTGDLRFVSVIWIWRCPSSMGFRWWFLSKVFSFLAQLMCFIHGWLSLRNVLWRIRASVVLCGWWLLPTRKTKRKKMRRTNDDFKELERIFGIKELE